ncbi:MAG: acyltransferase [Bacteroidales bacterium]|nr:acyltransferase [Bacteroidales bacterium]
MVQKSETGKLAGFEFLRFFFMIWICLIHIWTPFKIYHGGIGVDFFFMTAGLFLLQGFEKAQVSVYQYTRKRFFRLFPAYLIGVLLGFIFLLIDGIKDGVPFSAVGLTESFLTESLMIQDIGWFTHQTLGNPVSWFVSVLFIASVLLYAALRWNSRLTINILLPVFCIGYYTLLAHLGDLGTAFYSMAVGPLFLPLGRGIAGLSLGILIGSISHHLIQGPRQEKTALHLLALLFLCLVTCYILFVEENHDTFAIVFFAFIVVSCAIPDSWLNRLFNHRIWFFLGGITYEMLMMQIPCRYLINFGYNLFPLYRSLWIVAYLLLTILSAYLLKIGLKRVLHKM